MGEPSPRGRSTCPGYFGLPGTEAPVWCPRPAVPRPGAEGQRHTTNCWRRQIGKCPGDRTETWRGGSPLNQKFRSLGQVKIGLRPPDSSSGRKCYKLCVTECEYECVCGSTNRTGFTESDWDLDTCGSWVRSYSITAGR